MAQGSMVVASQGSPVVALLPSRTRPAHAYTNTSEAAGSQEVRSVGISIQATGEVARQQLKQ